MIRAQAAADIRTPIVTETDVDEFLIYSAIADRYRDMGAANAGTKRDISAPDVRPSDHPEHQLPSVIGLVATSQKHPGPFGGCETQDKGTGKRETDFFSSSLSRKAVKPQSKKSDIHVQTSLTSRTRPQEPANAKLSSTDSTSTSRGAGSKGSAKQKPHPLGPRIRTGPIRSIHNVSAIVDTGAQVTTMPESAVSQMPSAHNHRHAPPGTAVKYGNGEYEAIETLVDIGQFEVQVTPDNCEATLISVDQIVSNGHNVTFSETATTIADVQGNYVLQYPRASTHDSREWRVPMTALEDITRMRQQHPYTPMDA
jgi:hypothetical protein